MCDYKLGQVKMSAALVTTITLSHLLYKPTCHLFHDFRDLGEVTKNNGS